MKQRMDKKKKTKLLIVGGAIVLASLLIVVAWRLSFPQPNSTAKKASSQHVPVSTIDKRSDSVKQASDTASLQEGNGDTNGALATINQAIQSIPSQNTTDLSALYMQKASILINAGRKDEAVAAQQQVIALDPNNWKSYEDLGNLYAYAKDKTNALAAYQKADELLQQSDVYPQYHPELQGRTDRVEAGQ